ncbi:MAG: DUF6138 family protein [Kofleriaceae bacterium]
MTEPHAIEYREHSVLITSTVDDLVSPAGLATALDELLDVTSDLRSLLRVGPDHRTELFELASWWVTPDGKVDERELFARCVRHEELHDRMVRYVRQIAAGQVGITFSLVEGLCHDAMFPAGSFAVVPLAFHSPHYLPLLVEHLRSVDLGHESFHRALIDRLLATHGICEETFDLLVFRAGDGVGQAGMDNLRSAVHWHQLRQHWTRFGGADGFRERLRERSESLPDDAEDPDYIQYRLKKIGACLLGDEPGALEQWLVACEKDWGLRIHRDELPPRQRPPRAVTDEEWRSEWEQPITNF